MTEERRRRNVPVHNYAPDQGSEDDSNHGNDSNNESEFESQSSIGSESSIDYQDDDNDDHKGTGEGNEIESSSSDESEHYHANVAFFVGLYDVEPAMAEAYLRRNNNDLNDAMSEYLEHSQESGEDTTGTRADDAIELLSPADENEGGGSEVGEDTKTEGSDVGDETELLSSFQEDVASFMAECSIDETTAEQYLRRHNNNLDDAIPAYLLEGGQGSDVEKIDYEDMVKDITTGEVLDQNQPTLGCTNNQLLDPTSASHRSATQAVERSNAPLRGFETGSARDIEDVRCARKKRSSSYQDERNQPTIDPGM